MREFVLIDLRSQMPFLPLFMKKWRRNKLLAWLKIYGELRVFDEQKDTYFFHAWSGLDTFFILTTDGHMSIRSSRTKAWG